MTQRSKPLHDRVALVTGASRGLGQAIAHALDELGATVVLHGHSEAEVAKAAAPIGGRFVAAGLESREGCEFVVSEVEKRAGKVDILVNNAGLGGAGDALRIWEQDPDEYRRKMAINLDAPFHLTRLTAGQMANNGWGRIIMIASTVGKVGWPAAVYAASKHGLLGLMRSVALHGGPYAVTCNAVCPGTVRTPLSEKAVAWSARNRGVSADEVWRERAAGYPGGRFVTADEVAALVGFLALPASSGINGEAINVALGSLV